MIARGCTLQMLQTTPRECGDTPSIVRSLDGRIFRSNPDLVALRLDQLPQRQRRVFDAALFGVLRSARSRRDVMAIDVDTAALFLSLRTPQAHTRHSRVTLSPRDDTILARLVVDGILQIQRSDGVFVDGAAAALELFSFDAMNHRARPDHPLDEQAYRALRYAAMLRHLDGPSIARRLYQYGTHPRTATWERQFGDRAATARWLGLGHGRHLTKTLRAVYVAQRASAKGDPWFRWRLHASSAQEVPRYKIYISPQPAQVREAFSTVVHLCCTVRVPAFKIGVGPLGLLRPDKLVLYFTDPEMLWSVARQLSLQLHDCPPHGVPFSAAIDAGGLLSWGIDPPQERAFRTAGGASWRAFITHHLGSALAWRAADAPDFMIAFALQRLRLEGIDPDSWQMSDGW